MKNMTMITGIIIIVSLVSVAYATEQKAYDLNLAYVRGAVLVKDVSVTTANINPVTDQPADGYELRVVSSNNAILYTEKFKFPLEIKYETYSSDNGTRITGTLLLENASLELLIPYYADGNQIDVYAPDGTKAVEIPLTLFTYECGNAVCEPGEGYESCPQDCSPAAAEPIPTGTDYNPLIGVLTVIVAFAAFIYWKSNSRVDGILKKLR